MMEDYPLLTDLIPKRLGTFWVLFLFGVVFVCVIEFCYFKLPHLSRLMQADTVAAFDVTQRDSVASWLMTVLWLGAGCYSALIYLITRNDNDFRRLSDIWIWAAVACLFLSLDQIAGIRILFRDLMILITGTPLYGNGDLWWVAFYLIVFGMIGTRVLTEIRYYLPACNSLLMAGTFFIVGGCAELKFLLANDPALNAALCSGASMLGGLFLLLSTGLYGRQLIITDPSMYNVWYSSIWRKLSRQVNPTLYKYKSSDHYENGGEYQTASPQRPRRQQTAAGMKARNEYWDDEDHISPTDQETIRRRKGRLKKEKKGVFY